MKQIRRLLAANRSEIAIRVFRTAHELGIRTVAMYSHEDRYALHRFKADEAYPVGKEGQPLQSYLNIEGVIALAKEHEIDAIHPGYGFLSENPKFARACEEAGILPDLAVIIEDLQPDRTATAKSSRYRVTVVDNGPGIVRKQVENIFGRLLYGSKFHRLKMSRGQQGIGISAAGMYGLITTGRAMLIHTKPKAAQKAHHIELAMNTKTNRAEVILDEETNDFPPARVRSLTPGTREPP